MGKHSIAKREKSRALHFRSCGLRSAARQATSMTRRRLLAESGAAAGGLLGLAFLPLAVAHADEWTVTPDPNSVETVTGIYGYGFAGFDLLLRLWREASRGIKTFDYTDTTTGISGTFTGLEST